MTATGFPPLPAEMTARCATGYQWRALSDYLDPAPPMPPVWAEGGLWSSVGDLATWISFQLRAYTEPEATAPVLDAASLRDMHTPRYLADDQWTQAWGISWCGTRRDDTVWTGHAGGIPGFTSAICFNPAAQVGAVVLLNGTIGSADVAMDLAAATGNLTRHRPTPGTLPAPAPENYQPLLGIYAPPSLGGRLIRLEWAHGKLAFTAAEAPGWQIILTPTPDPDLFTITDGGNLSGGNVTFRRSGDGRIRVGGPDGLHLGTTRPGHSLSSVQGLNGQDPLRQPRARSQHDVITGNPAKAQVSSKIARAAQPKGARQLVLRPDTHRRLRAELMDRRLATPCRSLGPRHYALSRKVAVEFMQDDRLLSGRTQGSLSPG